MSTSTLSLTPLAGPSHTPHPPQPLIALQIPKPESPDSLGGWIRGIIDKPKYAIFEAKVLIEELGNVPQMQGKFRADWRFRGRAPHGKNASGLTPKPSLPNIKLNQPTPNESTISLKSNRSSAESSIRSVIPTLSPPASLPPSPSTAKRSSEPTPLRQSIKPESAPATPIPEIPRSTSPEMMSPADVPARARQDSLDSAHTTSTDKSQSSNLVYFGKPRPTERSLPTPRAPAARFGSTPHASTLLDPVPGRDDYPLIRPARPRVPSASQSSVNLPPPTNTSRPRILSGAHKKPPDPTGSSHRKGSTPTNDLNQYTCDWSYAVHHTIRIPFGKSVSASGATTPNRRETAPILGGGAASDSGVSIEIYEIPTASTTVKDSSMTKDSQKHVPQRTTTGEKVLYGMVDIDLAPFAGRGKVGRRFLLKGCKTNATLKVTVEMRQVGGDTHWAAPPMVEGHHVTGLVRDLVGDEPVHDLNLARNSSGSSSGSSSGGVNRSATSLGRIRTRSNPSFPRPEKSYDHHLKPSDAHRPPPLSRINTPEAPVPTIRPEPTLTARRSDYSLRSSHIAAQRARRLSRHKHTSHKGFHELPADAVIEAIFNPQPAAEEGPMTYVPARADVELEPEMVVLESLDGDDEKLALEGEKGVWKRMRRRTQSRGHK